MNYDAIIVLCKKCRQFKFAAIDNKKTQTLYAEEIESLVLQGHTLMRCRPRLVYNYRQCTCGEPKKTKDQRQMGLLDGI